MYLELLFALKVFHQALEVDVCHLAEEGQEAGHILSLPIGKQRTDMWANHRKAVSSEWTLRDDDSRLRRAPPQTDLWQLPFISDSLRRALTPPHKQPAYSVMVSMHELDKNNKLNSGQRDGLFYFPDKVQCDGFSEVCEVSDCKNNRKTYKKHSLVCLFWGTVETWQCNMVDSVEEGPHR